MRRTNIPGHGLVGEGAPHSVIDCAEPACVNEGRQLGRLGWHMGVGGDGHGVCLCGAISPHLASSVARKRWHAQHKDAVRAVS